MPYKSKPIAYERVEISVEEQKRINELKKKSLKQRMNRNPEEFKLKKKEENRRAYLKRKQRLAEEKKKQVEEEKTDM